MTSGSVATVVPRLPHADRAGNAARVTYSGHSHYRDGRNACCTRRADVVVRTQRRPNLDSLAGMPTGMAARLVFKPARRCDMDVDNRGPVLAALGAFAAPACTAAGPRRRICAL